jgi:hypothetical protein
VKWLRLPIWLELPIALILLDYLLYLWHVAFHKAPFLWRFHQVHHVDLDMDASTAIRFHFGEMVMSTALQILQMLIIGVTPLTFSIWNIWLISEIMFHHSNVELPFGVERWLCKIVVTTLGVAAFPDAKELTHPKLMEMPFDEQQRYPPWVRPDGSIPERDEIVVMAPETLVPEAAKHLTTAPTTRRA